MRPITDGRTRRLLKATPRRGARIGGRQDVRTRGPIPARVRVPRRTRVVRAPRQGPSIAPRRLVAMAPSAGP